MIEIQIMLTDETSSSKITLFISKIIKNKKTKTHIHLLNQNQNPIITFLKKFEKLPHLSFS